jgi:coniferyl-aldehyde dehydrogenase
MDLQTALQIQRAAFNAEMPVPLNVRQERLTRACRMLTDHADAFCKALSDDFGHRSREQSMIADIVASVRTLKHARDHLVSWSRPERRKLDFPLGVLGARARIEFQPKGVVGVIAPWNFPVQLTMGPLAGIFAAGNRAMVKSSESTPRTASLFEEVAPRYFDAAELAFVSGGPEVGREFAALPFDHLIFTGATGVGRHILHAAADNLTPVTLELGGKSPTIIGRSADLAMATERIALGKLMNAGQICLAPDYLLVPADKEEAVVGGLRAAVSTVYPRMLDNPDYTAVINERHHVRLQGYLEDARNKGGEVIEINPAAEDFASSNGTKMPLFLVRNPTDDMAVMKDEIFGPILPIVRYDRIEDAISFVNRRDRPLGLYYFGQDAAEEKQVLDRTISGGVTVNDVIFHVSAEDLPFGGIGPSGMGAYHGRDGFKTFSHARAVYRQPRIDIAGLAGFKPPYGNATAKTIARQLKSGNFTMAFPGARRYRRRASTD